jgi:hypothetical protein
VIDFCLTALDLAPPPVRADERLDQRLIAPRLRRRHGWPFGSIISFPPPQCWMYMDSGVIAALTTV